MIQESYNPLLNDHNLQTTFYVSLVIANILFGLMHPELSIIALSGIAFFMALVLRHVLFDQRPKA